MNKQDLTSKASDRDPTSEVSETHETTSDELSAPAPENKNVLRGRQKKAKRRSADKIEPKSKPKSLKLPFEFADQQISEGVARQLCDACATGDDLDDNLFSSMASTMLSQRPKDPFELMLINQTSGVNAQVMRYIGILHRSEMIPEIDTAERALSGGFAARLQ